MSIQDEAYENIKNNLYVLQEHYDLSEDWVMETALEIAAMVRDSSGYDLETQTQDEPGDDDDAYDVWVDNQLSSGDDL